MSQPYVLIRGQNQTALIVFLPTDGSTPVLKGVTYNYINRYNGPTAGDGDVLIKHTTVLPTQDDIRFFDEPLELQGLHLSTSETYNYTLKDRGVDVYYRAYETGVAYASYDGIRYGLGVTLYSCIGYSTRWDQYQYRYYDAYSAIWDTSVKRDITNPTSWPEFSSLVALAHRMIESSACPTMWSTYGNTLRIDIGTPKYTPSSDAWDSYLESRSNDIPVSSYNYELDGNQGFYEAFYQALEKLPELQQNTLANIRDGISLVRSLSNGFDLSDLHKPIKKVSGDLWLRYRYQYNTTISDLSEITQSAARLMSVTGKTVMSYGHGRGSNGTSYFCAIEVLIPKLDSINSVLKYLNLRPTLYNAWDMVPYSFVVDWFLDVGSCLEGLQSWLDMPTANIGNVWYTAIKSTYEPGLEEVKYMRFRGKSPTLPYVSHSDPSLLTVAKRGLDVISLLV